MNTKLLSEIEMPAERRVPTHMTVAISAVMIGDARGDRVVRNIKTGPKNTELLDEHGKRIDYMPNSTGVLITRYVPDQEVQDRRYRIGRHNRILDSIRTRREGVEKAQQALAAEVAELGYVGHWKLSDLIARSAETKLWEEFAHFVERLAAREGEKAFEGDLVDAKEAFAEILKEDVLTTHRHRALSRSTGVVSNLLDDVDMEARVGFIDRTNRWY